MTRKYGAPNRRAILAELNSPFLIARNCIPLRLLPGLAGCVFKQECASVRASPITHDTLSCP